MDFALNDEQLEYKERCRNFAREVIRPAARKHDEEESIPWEVIKEARRQGFGGLEAIQRSAADPEGQMQVISAEEFHWGCAGIALAISGSGLAAAGIASSGTPEQIAQLGPRVLRQRRRDQARRLRGDRAAGRLRRQEPEDDRQARRRRVGPQRDQGLHHQRRHRRRPRRRRHRRPRARHPRPGLVRRRQGHPGPQPGQEGDASSGSAPRTPPRSCSRTAGSRSRTCSAARRSWRRSCERGRSGQKSRSAPTRWRPSR